MAEYQVVDIRLRSPEGEITERFLTRDGEIYIPTIYWHLGKRRYTFGSEYPGKMILAGLWDQSAVQAADIDGKTIWFIAAATACDVDSENKTTYENMRRKVLA